MNPRQRRLATDWEAIREDYSGHDAVTVEPVGPFPPEEYVVTYRLPGLARLDDQPTMAQLHRVRIHLPLSYPRDAPYCIPLTPIFHPNIGEHYCIGDYWAAGEPLIDIIAKIGDMIQFRIFNTRSPLDIVAARYVDANDGLFPLGEVELRPPDVEVVRGGTLNA